ncbi:MAG: von Willebrand factor type A domain-containing protein [Oscillospiraceae bacterium]|nr:von Willebrand factor type A domain-containing protein [Oscillospiraceae bacterium]
MKTKFLGLIMAVLMLAGVPAPAETPENAQLQAETVTRGEFVAMFVEAFIADRTAPVSAAEFSDVPDSDPNRAAILIATNAGLMSGYGDGTFHPDDEITYEQALNIIVRYVDGYSRNYPLGCVRSALDMGLADGVTAMIGDQLSRAQAERLIENTKAYLPESNEIDDDDSVYSWGWTISSPGNPMNPGSGGGGGGGSVAKAGLTLSEPSDSFGFYNGYFNTEEYTSNEENVFKNVVTSPLSTFSIDTDTASYSNMRRYVLGGSVPPKGSIRTEELINYFDFNNPLPEDGTPFAVSSEVAVCPWNSGNYLAMLSVQGDELKEKLPSNLVFLLDISGSMYDSNKLPLVKTSMKMLLDQLDENDRVSIVVYASGTGVVLESTPVSEKEKIIAEIDKLRAYGATNGSAGLNLAYEQAEKSLIDGNNRIILCTDGDFNVGPSSTGELEKLIEEKRDKGIFLTVLGFGMGNYKDNRMETMADKGNGTYAYIDSAREAKKVFVDELPKTLYTIAKDVKIQVEFNPEKVKEYRLIGYENRVLNNEDFDNDQKDAGELQSGSNVTVFYEIVPADSEAADAGLRYQTRTLTGSDELMNVKIRYKEPKGDESILREYPITGELSEPSADFRFAAAVAELGMILNDSEYKGISDLNSVISLAKEGIGEDALGFRTEFLHLVDLMKYTNEY